MRASLLPICLPIFLSFFSLGRGDGWAPQLGLPRPGIGNPAAVASPTVTSPAVTPSGPPRAIGRPADSAAGCWAHYWPRRAALSLSLTLTRRTSEASVVTRYTVLPPAQSERRDNVSGGASQRLHAGAWRSPARAQRAAVRTREGGCRLCQPALPAGSAAARTSSVCACCAALVDLNWHLERLRARAGSRERHAEEHGIASSHVAPSWRSSAACLSLSQAR